MNEDQDKVVEIDDDISKYFVKPPPRRRYAASRREVAARIGLINNRMDTIGESLIELAHQLRELETRASETR